MHALLFAIVLGASTPAQAAASQEDAVMSSVNLFVNSFNKGDAKAAAALCAEETSIIDEFPPYEWHGPKACMKWIDDFGVDAKKNAITNGSVTLGKPRHVEISGDLAYVVIPSDYDYKEKGKPVKQKGSMFTLVLKKAAEGWRITAWSWASN
jgi:ketosteroid isomerase-like protein